MLFWKRPLTHFVWVSFSLAALLGLGTITGCGKDSAISAPIQFEDPQISDEELRDMIDEVLEFTFTERTLSLSKNAAWQILHGALPYGQKFQVLNGDTPVGAIDWVLDGNQMRGWTLRHGTKDLDGRQGLKMVLESGSKAGQGHEDQWLAVISQSGYSSDHPVIFQGRTYQLGDVVRQVMWDVYQGKECSWTLIGLTRYLSSDYFTENTKWKNRAGEDWDLEKLIAMEADQDLRQSACGGTHRLIGMTMALKRYQEETGKTDEQLTGGWAAARKKIRESIEAARIYQREDGSFSSNYFFGPGKTSDLSVRINKSGHTLEVLALALDDETIKEPWVTHAVINLCDLFHKTRTLDLECGGLYHATHGLMEYRERRFGPWTYPGEPSPGTSQEEAPADAATAKGSEQESTAESALPPADGRDEKAATASTDDKTEIE